MHTQQRNRSERCELGRFWKGVAQITRRRDRTFIASLCSITLFSISSIWRADRCVGTRRAGFPLSRVYFPRIARRKQRLRCRIAHRNHRRSAVSLRQRDRRAQHQGCAARSSARLEDWSRSARSQLQQQHSKARLPTLRKALFFRLEMPFRYCAGNSRCRCIARSHDSNSIQSWCRESPDTAIGKRESESPRRAEAEAKIGVGNCPEAVLPNPRRLLRAWNKSVGLMSRLQPRRFPCERLNKESRSR
jgi:hypothetical protein